MLDKPIGPTRTILVDRFEKLAEKRGCGRIIAQAK